MGGAFSGEKENDVAVFNDLAAEFAKVQEKPEEEQFEHMRAQFKERTTAQRIPTTCNVLAAGAKPKKKHMHLHLKTIAMMGEMLTHTRRQNMNMKGVDAKQLASHISSDHFNQPHPELGHDELITNALGETIFAKKERAAMQAAIRVATELTYDPGTEIVKQGSEGNTYYVVETGTLDVVKNGTKTGTYIAGQHFGELSLIYNDKAEATVTVSTDGPAKLWLLNRQDFNRVQSETHGGTIYKRAQWLRKVESFKVLTDNQIVRICSELEEKSYATDEVIAKQGASGDTFYLIVKGTVAEWVSGRRHSNAANEDAPDAHQITTLEGGEFFGEHAMINRPHHYNATYKGGEEGATLLLMKQDVMDQILGPLHQVLEDADKLNSLLSAGPPLDQVANHKSHALRMALQPLVKQMAEVDFKKGDVIVPRDSVGPGLYMLKTGEVDGYGATFGDGDTFGEDVLVETPPGAEKDVVALRDCVTFLLPRDIAMTFLDEHQKRSTGTASHCEDRSRIKFEDLEDLGLLGEGSFGTVTMVKAVLKDCGSVEVLALKRMGKNHLIEEDMLESTQMEKDILGGILPSPFVLRLYATFQDRDSVYMLTNLLQGGELYDYLHTEGETRELSREHARFYTANIFLALSHLHTHGFVYRDMKPENVLIGADGYLCLIDLGFAKACPYEMEVDGEWVYHEQCYTTCGTPEYMAPEFIFQTGHDKGADYWALGCLIFEMFHGHTPFVDRNDPDDLSQIFVNIALHNNDNYELPFKKEFLDGDLELEKQLINDILNPRSSFRLGVVGKGRDTFMEHPWFQNKLSEGGSAFDWGALENKQLEPPYIPHIADEFDKSAFRNKQSQLEPDPFDVENYEFDPFEGW